MSTKQISPLRQRMIDDMASRNSDKALPKTFVVGYIFTAQLTFYSTSTHGRTFLFLAVCDHRG